MPHWRDLEQTNDYEESDEYGDRAVAQAFERTTAVEVDPQNNRDLSLCGDIHQHRDVAQPESDPGEVIERRQNAN